MAGELGRSPRRLYTVITGPTAEFLVLGNKSWIPGVLAAEGAMGMID